MTNLLEYDPDWKQKFWKNNPNWTIGEFLDMTAQMKEAKKRADEETQSAETGQIADEPVYTMSDGTQTRNWGAAEHDRMYPGHQAAANAAGFRFLGATRLNPDYVERQDKIRQAMGFYPGEKYKSGDWKGTFGDMTPEEINATIEQQVLGINTSGVDNSGSTVDISGILGDIFKEDEENVV
jgi:hypothetical protein|tara:strand:+ start:58 stop:600 length:543 start_codon:yes stop_codon:yes gene_type:complete